MNYQILTHAEHERDIRRFFVSNTERLLYRKIENEISRIISRRIAVGEHKQMSLNSLYKYVENRWFSLDPSEFKDFVYIYRFLAHMKDYCDIAYIRVFGKLPAGLPHRMKKFSEPLLINKKKGMEK